MSNSITQTERVSRCLGARLRRADGGIRRIGSLLKRCQIKKYEVGWFQYARKRENKTRFLLCPLSKPPSEGWVVAGDPSK